MLLVVVVVLACIGIGSIIHGIYSKGVNDGANDVDENTED